MILANNTQFFYEYICIRFGNLTKPSFRIISHLTASNPNIYQATWEHPFNVDPLIKHIQDFHQFEKYNAEFICM